MKRRSFLKGAVGCVGAVAVGQFFDSAAKAGVAPCGPEYGTDGDTMFMIARAGEDISRGDLITISCDALGNPVAHRWRGGMIGGVGMGRVGCGATTRAAISGPAEIRTGGI